MKTVNLQDGDCLSVLPETEEFLFQCCKCGITHRFEVKWAGTVNLFVYRHGDMLQKMRGDGVIPAGEEDEDM